MINYFNIERNISQKITFKQLFSNIKIENKDEKKFRKSIEKITLELIMNEKSTSIRKYKDENYNYSEIFILSVDLVSIDSIDLIEFVLHRAFPNPIVLVLKYKDSFRISIFLKRINKNDETKTVIEFESNSDFINIRAGDSYLKLLDSTKTDSKHLKDYYEYLFFWCLCHFSKKYIAEIDNVINDWNILRILSELDDIDRELLKYISEKNSGRLVASKMEAHKNILKLRNQKDNNIKKLKEIIL